MPRQSYYQLITTRQGYEMSMIPQATQDQRKLLGLSSPFPWLNLALSWPVFCLPMRPSHLISQEQNLDAQNKLYQAA
jgi:hypothetical protein